MIAHENILNLGIRKEIYNFILKNPGLHLREISRRMNISMGCLRHHINYLKKLDIIILKNDHRYIRCYVKQKVGEKDEKIINLLRQEVPLRIILLLLTPGPGEIYIDNKTRDDSKKNPETFLKTYSKKELIELTKYWNGLYGGLFHVYKHRTTIGFHIEKLLTAGLIEKIKIGKEVKYRLKDEEMVWVFLFMNKEALSNDSINVYLSWHKDYIKNGTELLLKAVFEIFPHPYYA